MKLLIVEDEPLLNQSMTEFLKGQGYLCESVSDLQAAIEKTELFDYDCIILDLMLPGGSGLKLLHELKRNNKTDGVVILTAKDSLDDKIEGFRLGADDYITKPFHLAELNMRVAAVIRRKGFHGESVVKIGSISIDTLGQSVTVHQQPLELTQKEYQLLLFFSVNRNRVLSKSAIAQHLWGDDMDLAVSPDVIYTHIKNLRKKIEAAGGEDVIRSLYRQGYKMQDV